jgi:hypothetical protein
MKPELYSMDFLIVFNTNKAKDLHFILLSKSLKRLKTQPSKIFYGKILRKNSTLSFNLFKISAQIT